MKATNKTNSVVKKAISKFAIKTAVNSTNTTCLLFQYQPKEPKNIRQLIKNMN